MARSKARPASRLNVPRLIGAALIGLVLFGLLAAQAISGVLTRQAPGQASAVFPGNGIALERQAFREFQESFETSQDLEVSANAASSLALRSLSIDPLAPKSHSIIAMTLGEEGEGAQSEKRLAVLEAASRLNRRDLSLQGLVLQERLVAEDFPQVIATLDQILRTHPEYRPEFYPVLVDAMARPETQPVFSRILSESSPWHNRFLQFAVRDPRARVNLASIRSDIVYENKQFDLELVSGLASQGELEVAQQLYIELTEGGERVAQGVGLAWASDFPPFDWQLTDESNFRSQPSRDEQKLEIFVRPGQGGMIARRTIPLPEAAFTLSVIFEPGGPVRRDAVRVQLGCGLSGAAFFDEGLESGNNSFTIEQVPSDCERMTIAIDARALRGEPTLRAELGRIQIEAR